MLKKCVRREYVTFHIRSFAPLFLLSIVLGLISASKICTGVTICFVATCYRKSWCRILHNRRFDRFFNSEAFSRIGEMSVPHRDCCLATAYTIAAQHLVSVTLALATDGVTSHQAVHAPQWSHWWRSSGSGFALPTMLVKAVGNGKLSLKGVEWGGYHNLYWHPLPHNRTMVLGWSPIFCVPPMWPVLGTSKQENGTSLVGTSYIHWSPIHPGASSLVEIMESVRWDFSAASIFKHIKQILT